MRLFLSLLAISLIEQSISCIGPKPVISFKDDMMRKNREAVAEVKANSPEASERILEMEKYTSKSFLDNGQTYYEAHLVESWAPSSDPRGNTGVSHMLKYHTDTQGMNQIILPNIVVNYTPQLNSNTPLDIFLTDVSASQVLFPSYVIIRDYNQVQITTVDASELPWNGNISPGVNISPGLYIMDAFFDNSHLPQEATNGQTYTAIRTFENFNTL